MATMSKVVIATLLSTSALAAPLLPRAWFTEVVTKTEWVTEYMADTTWVNDAPFKHRPTHSAAVASATATEVPAVTTEAMSEAGFLPATAPTTLTTTTPPAIVPIQTPMTTPAITTTPLIEAPAVTSTMPTSTESPPPAALPTTAAATTNTPVAPAPTPQALTPGSGPSSGSTTGTCEGESNPCEGDVTYWTGGLGACGTTVDTTTDYAIALPFAFMGTLSNTNPYCGRSVTLYNPSSGTTVQATVMDKCMGCVDRAIDCTEVLFNAITDNLGNGRESGIVWWLN